MVYDARLRGTTKDGSSDWVVPPLCPSFLQSQGSNFVAWDAHDTARCGVWTLCIAKGSFAQEVHFTHRVQQSFRSMWHPCSRVQTACRRLAVFYFLGCLFSTCTGRYGRLPPTPCHENAPGPLTGDGWCGEETSYQHPADDYRIRLGNLPSFHFGTVILLRWAKAKASSSL